MGLVKIAVASGKGGTGKTLVSVSLARLYQEQGRAVAYVDADAEEPNGHLFLSPRIAARQRFTVRVPVLREETCAGHGRCQETCAFNAILATKRGVLVFNELCHGCGACLLACPDGALTEADREIGTISFGAAEGVRFVSGLLDVGEARVTPLIAGVVEAALELRFRDDEIVLLDAPPGTSCSAIAAVEEADLVLLVAEPTPFGIHDLELALELGRTLEKRMVVVVNRADLGDGGIDRMLSRFEVPVLGRIPFDRAVAECYAAGGMPVVECPEFRSRLTALSRELLEHAKKVSA